MLALALTAELEGVTDLIPIDTAESPYYYTFKVQCTSCRETHANWVGVSRHAGDILRKFYGNGHLDTEADSLPQDLNDQSGSRGEANFVWKCKNCKRESSANIKAAPEAYVQTSPAKPKKVIEIDCRGLEFTDFKPDGEWEAKGIESGTKFSGIDLSEGEWFDYDEKAGEEVSIRDIKWQIRRA